MLREIQALRSAVELVQSDSRTDTLLAVVTVAVVVIPLLQNRRT